MSFSAPRVASNQKVINLERKRIVLIKTSQGDWLYFGKE
jgi:hypothetical protein